MGKYSVSKQDRDTLRGLAKYVQMLSAQPDMAQKRRDWIAHNRLYLAKPMILCFPEGAWRECLPTETMTTSQPLLKDWEWKLRATIYTAETLEDDWVIDPVFNLNWVHKFTDCGFDIPFDRVDTLGSFKWTPPLQNLDDIKKLKPVKLEVDEPETKEQLSLAQDIFGDILEVRIRGSFWWSLGVFQKAIYLRGLEQIMLDMHDNPAWLHDLISRLTAEVMEWLTYLESNNYLSLNNQDDYVGSGGVGYTDELPAAGYNPEQIRCQDIWGFAEAQELVGVSPEMFNKFFLQYTIPILSRFGLNCYGCCEPVHDKFELIKQIPRLRRVSVSPWTDITAAAIELQDKFIYSYKPNPSPLAAFTFDEAAIRESLKQVMQLAKEYGCVLEVILKDTHTVQNDPSRLAKWVELAKQVRYEIYQQ
ncbi:MAG: hypothetical protein ACE14V_05080 [bacterium]